MDPNDSRIALQRSRVVLLLVSATLIFVSCGGGSSSPPPPPPPPSKLPTPTVLRSLYRVLNSSIDRATTFGPDEGASHVLEAQTYYVPDQLASDRIALNRVVNSSGSDHADTTTSLSGYSEDLVLGYPWSSSSTAGVVPLLEAFDSSTGDYALVSPSENLPGYSSQPLPAYGYPRYGNAVEALLSLSAGGVTVQSNAVAGGTTWRWYWNGIQFLNHADYGREIQDAFYFGTSLLNPNEAGDQLTYSFLDQSLKHGSPILQFENQGNTQLTRAVPLNWDPTQYGGDQDHPVIWDTLVLGKNLTLNFQDMGAVAQYTTHLTVPAATQGTLANPAGYLLSSFNRFWTYNAKSKTVEEVTAAMPDGCTVNTNTTFGGYAFFVDYGGIIMSDAAGANAMGVYAVSLAKGGSVTYFAMWKFYCWGDGPSEDASDNTAWSAVYGNGTDVTFPAGESTYNVYLMTDSVQNVTAMMDALFQMGVH